MMRRVLRTASPLVENRDSYRSMSWAASMISRKAGLNLPEPFGQAEALPHIPKAGPPPA